MPQDPVIVYYVADNMPTVMHWIDAAEAVRLGDYAYASAIDTHDINGKELSAHRDARHKGEARIRGHAMPALAEPAPDANDDLPPDP